MRAVYGYIPLIIVLAAGCLVALFIQPITKWARTNRAMTIGAPIGNIGHVEGSVRRIHGSDIELIPVNLDISPDLRDGDKIQTSLASKADLSLYTGEGFEVPAFSGVQFNRWDPLDDKSPVYIRVLFGSFVRGPSTQAATGIFVIEKGKLYPAKTIPPTETLGLTVKAADAYFLKNLPPMAAAGVVRPSSVKDINPETLSLEYINDSLVVQRDRLRNCWHSYIKGADGLKNHMQIDFEIENSGAIKNVKVVKNTVEDETLKSCVAKIFEQLSFRPFTGSKLTESFPVEFE